MHLYPIFILCMPEYTCVPVTWIRDRDIHITNIQTEQMCTQTHTNTHTYTHTDITSHNHYIIRNPIKAKNKSH